MKIAVHSDLHLEGYMYHQDFLSDTNFDVLVLAGDIVSARTINRLECIRELNEDKPIIYIAGNHEYYRGSINGTNANLQAKCDELNIMFGNRKTFEINGVHFVCATGWSDLQSFEQIPYELKRINAGGVNDFYVIEGHTIDAMIDLAKGDKEFIEGELERLVDQQVVVVTHFSPTENHGNERFEVSPISSYFSNNWVDLMYNYQPKVWVYGHTHGNVCSKVYQTDVICNQRGYGNENPNYKPNFIFEVV